MLLFITLRVTTTTMTQFSQSLTATSPTARAVARVLQRVAKFGIHVGGYDDASPTAGLLTRRSCAANAVRCCRRRARRRSLSATCRGRSPTMRCVGVAAPRAAAFSYRRRRRRRRQGLREALVKAGVDVTACALELVVDEQRRTSRGAPSILSSSSAFAERASGFAHLRFETHEAAVAGASSLSSSSRHPPPLIDERASQRLFSFTASARRRRLAAALSLVTRSSLVFDRALPLTHACVDASAVARQSARRREVPLALTLRCRLVSPRVVATARRVACTPPSDAACRRVSTMFGSAGRASLTANAGGDRSIASRVGRSAARSARGRRSARWRRRPPPLTRRGSCRASSRSVRRRRRRRR